MTYFQSLITALTLLLPMGALAQPVSYDLQQDRSDVGFVYTLAGAENRGAMPVISADIIIDFEQFTASTVDVSVDVTRASTGLIFATQALKASSVLDAANHPTIRFRSTAIRPNDPRNLSAGGEIDGQLTIKGVTRDVTLNAAVFRQQGTQAGDFRQLTFRITGAVSRSAFGASGYGDIVNDLIGLDIAARIMRAP